MRRLLLPLSLVLVASCGGSGGNPAPGAPTPNPTPTPTPNTYTVGGAVSGLGVGKSLVLQVNGAGNLTVSANGSFTFASAMGTGAGYTVTVQSQPVGQICVVTNEAGTVGSANITNVSVTCRDGIADSWIGTGSSTSAAINATAQVTWTFERTAGNIASYRPTGTASAVLAACSIAPSSGTLDPTGGVLFVDYNATPPTYHGTGLTQWSATWSCPPAPPFVNPVTAAYFGGSRGTLGVEAQGQVSPDGLTIQGSDTNQGVAFTWTFIRSGIR